MKHKTSLNVVIAQTLMAAMFLSRLPLNGLLSRFVTNGDDADFSQTTRYFGLAAIIIALPSALVLWITLLLGLSPVISAILAISAHVLVTGALHEDALGDVADGFGGGDSVTDKLKIMRDSQIGTYGAVALILSFALQISLLAQIVESTLPGFGPLILILINIIATLWMLWPWVVFDPAREEGGLSKNHGMPTMESMGIATLTGVPVALVLGSIVFGFYQTMIALAISFAAAVLFSFYCNRQIGGHTGDTLGATKKISELALLLGLVMFT